jgi:tetratricopeptide (TPR) repeat protein
MKRYTEKAFRPDSSDLNHEAFKSGYQLFKAGRYKKAITAFKDAVSYWPKDAQAWMALGNCYDELNRPVDAEKCFRRALSYCTEKHRDEIGFNLGNSLLDQERCKAAIECYDQIPPKSALFNKAQKNRLIAEQSLKELRGDVKK